MARIGDMLIKEGLITVEQLEEAIIAQKREERTLGEVLTSRGLVTEAQLADVLSRQTGVPKFTGESRLVDASLAKIIPPGLAAKFFCAPLMLTGKLLSVGFLDPDNTKAIDTLFEISGKTIKAMVIERRALTDVWVRLYGTSAPGELIRD